MRILKLPFGLCLALFGSALCVQAVPPPPRPHCENLNGRISETIITGIDDAVAGNANLDQIPRVLGDVSGDLKGSATSIITSLVPASPTVFDATTVDIFLTEGGDLLYAAGSAVFTQIDGQAPGNFHDSLTLTISGGTGKFAGATGTINVTGEGHNVFDPTFGAGYFDLKYKGQACGLTK